MARLAWICFGVNCYSLLGEPGIVIYITYSLESVEMHRVFISYHHGNDQQYKDELVDFAKKNRIFIDASVDTGYKLRSRSATLTA